MLSTFLKQSNCSPKNLATSTPITFTPAKMLSHRGEGDINFNQNPRCREGNDAQNFYYHRGPQIARGHSPSDVPPVTALSIKNTFFVVQKLRRFTIHRTFSRLLLFSLQEKEEKKLARLLSRFPSCVELRFDSKRFPNCGESQYFSNGGVDLIFV